MGRIVVMNHLTLDGVMQAPGREDEDPRDGFPYGGWAELAETPDGAAGRAMGERLAAGGGLAGWLLGRRTYVDVLAYWNQQPDRPFGAMLSNAPKYVVSSTLAQPLPWPNTTLLGGDLIGAVRKLKAETAGVLAMMGSGELIQALVAGELIDEFLLMVHPLVLGTGRRMFPPGVRLPLKLTGTTTTATGVIITTYEPEPDRI